MIKIAEQDGLRLLYITERGWTVSLDGSRGDMYDKKKIERSMIGLCRSSHSVSGEI